MLKMPLAARKCDQVVNIEPDPDAFVYFMVMMAGRKAHHLDSAVHAQVVKKIRAAKRLFDDDGRFIGIIVVHDIVGAD